MSDDLATLVEQLFDIALQASNHGVHIGQLGHRDVADIEDAMWSVLARAVERHGEERDQLRDLANALGEIAEALNAGPSRPSDYEICRRYCAHEISRATVRELTGWDRDTLWSECLRRGLDPFEELP